MKNLTTLVGIASLGRSLTKAFLLKQALSLRKYAIGMLSKGLSRISSFRMIAATKLRAPLKSMANSFSNCSQKMNLRINNVCALNGSKKRLLDFEHFKAFTTQNSSKYFTMYLSLRMPSTGCAHALAMWASNSFLFLSMRKQTRVICQVKISISEEFPSLHDFEFLVGLKESMPCFVYEIFVIFS